MSSPSHFIQSGFTLVEQVAVLAIGSVLIGMLAPSMEQLRSRAHLRNAAAQIETDLQLARSAAVALNRVVQVAFSQEAATSCYVLHTGRRDDCTCDSQGVAQCAPDTQVLKTTSFGPNDGILVNSNSRTVGFEPVSGMVTPTATITTLSRTNEQIKLIINIMGRVRSCTPSQTVNGLPRC